MHGWGSIQIMGALGPDRSPKSEPGDPLKAKGGSKHSWAWPRACWGPRLGGQPHGRGGLQRVLWKEASRWLAIPQALSLTPLTPSGAECWQHRDRRGQEGP